MGTTGDGAQEGGQERVQDFIFARELAEVYLLLDHLSGRSDKSLTAAIGDGKDDTGSEWIQKICAIGWPPKGTAVEQSAQAATLLLAKDRLNAAAKPANGASIVFTLMVAGDDDVTAAQSRPFRRRRGLFSRSADGSPAPDKKGDPPNSSDSASEGTTADAVPLGAAVDLAPTLSPRGGGGGQNGGGNSTGVFGRYPPSRISLARLAYPGLIGSAGRFRLLFNVLLSLLFVFLIFTCVLSWHITAGRAILARLDAIETARAAIQKRIADAEVADGTRVGPDIGRHSFIADTTGHWFIIDTGTRRFSQAVRTALLRAGQPFASTEGRTRRRQDRPIRGCHPTPNLRPTRRKPD
jgi:hypothetical protein